MQHMSGILVPKIEYKKILSFQVYDLEDIQFFLKKYQFTDILEQTF